jgi:hypothetical protein
VVVWVAGLAAALLVFAWIVTGSNSFQACLQGDTNDLDETSYLRSAAEQIETPTALQCVGDFFDENEPSIVGLTALALAFFGFGIWSAGRRLHKTALAFRGATEEASRLRLRAQVGIAAIETQLGEMDIRRNAAENSILITVKNFGMTAAHQVGISAQVAAEPPSGRVIETREARASFTLFSGQSMAIPLVPAEALPETAETTYVAGHVRYRDQHGRKWRTNFCWAGQRGHAGTARFAPYGSHNDEIAET